MTLFSSAAVALAELSTAARTIATELADLRATHAAQNPRLGRRVDPVAYQLARLAVELGEIAREESVTLRAAVVPIPRPSVAMEQAGVV